MRQYLLAALTAAALIVTTLSLSQTARGDTAGPGGRHSHSFEAAPTQAASIQAASMKGGSVAVVGPDTEPSGFGSFWRKLRRALQKIRALIEIILDNTNDGSGRAFAGGAIAIDPEGARGGPISRGFESNPGPIAPATVA